MKYKVKVQWFSFVKMTVEDRPEYDRTYRWKWLALINELFINTAPRGVLGMYIASVIEVIK